LQTFALFDFFSQHFSPFSSNREFSSLHSEHSPLWPWLPSVCKTADSSTLIGEGTHATELYLFTNLCMTRTVVGSKIAVSVFERGRAEGFI
jgi:hypothetical protein